MNIGSVKELGVRDAGECLKYIFNMVLNGYINSLILNFLDIIF